MANFGKLNFAVAFNPQTAFPLDARCYFESKSAAEAAALKAKEVGSTESVYYFGETFVVNEGGVATLYIVQPDCSLKEVGSVPVGDGKSIEIVDEKIQLKGFGNGYYKYNADVEGHYEFVEGEFVAGLQPQVIAASEGTGFEIAWFEPNPTTVEGLESQISSLSGSVNTLSGKVDTNTTNINELSGRVSDLEGAGYATEAWVEGKNYLTEHQDISGKVDRSELSGYYTKTEADSQFMTEAEVDARVNKVITDAVEGDTLTSLTELVEYINEHGGEATELATAVQGLETDVQNLNTNKANKSEVYTKTESDTLLGNKADKSELFSGSYNDLTDKPEIPSVAGLASEEFVNEAVAGVEAKIPTNNNQLENGAGYITETALDGYATEAFVSSEITKAVTDGKVDLTGYATEKYVDDGIAAAKTELQTYADGAESDANAYTDSKILEVNNTIDALDERVVTNTNNIGTLQTNLSGVQEDVSELGNRVSEVETKAGNNESAIGALQTKVGTLETGKADNSVVEALDSRVSANETNISSNSGKITTINSNISSINTNINTINNTTIPNAISESKSYADGVAATAKSEAISAASQELADTIKNYSTTAQMNEAIATAVADAGHLRKEIVETLPESPVANVIYMIDEDGNGVYEEYTLINGGLEKIGDTSIDLTGYATEDWVATKIGEAITGAEDGVLIKSVNTDQLDVDAEGKLSIKAVSTDLLYVPEGSELILSGGEA